LRDVWAGIKREKRSRGKKDQSCYHQKKWATMLGVETIKTTNTTKELNQEGS